MNTKFARMITFMASRLLGTTSVLITLAWVVKYGMNTDHDTVLLLHWTMVSVGMLLVSLALDSVSESFKARSRRVRTKKRISMQNVALAECEDNTQICVNRMLMNINV